MPFKSILALEDGTIFYGDGYGTKTVHIGEVVFNTSMTGYQEIITDPSYKKQIITFTILILVILELILKTLSLKKYMLVE